MVLTAAQTTAFFTDADQMGFPAQTYAHMATEGITTVDDLVDFDSKTLNQLAENLRKPPGRVPAPGGPAGTTIPTPAFTFWRQIQKRLATAVDLIKYYDTVGRTVTVANIQWTQVMRNFGIQWKALKDKKEQDDPDVPKITRSLPVIKWSKAFPDFLSQVIRVRNIPLIYAIWPDAVPHPPDIPPNAANQPYTATYGSIEAELIARASHNHAPYCDDNEKVYHYLEEATRSTQYAASIKPFQRTKDGRGGWFANMQE